MKNKKNSPSNYLHVGKRRKQLNQARHFCATNYSEGQGESKRKSFRVILCSSVEALQATPYGGRLLVFFTSWKTLTTEQFSIDWPTPFRLQSPTRSSLIFSPSCWAVKSLHFLCWGSFYIPTTLQLPCSCWEKDLSPCFGYMHNLLQQHQGN